MKEQGSPSTPPARKTHWRARLRYRLTLALWPAGKITAWLGRLPVVGRLFAAKHAPEENAAIILPVQQNIRESPSVTLPYRLLMPLVERASAHAILAVCPCRKGERCSTYPHDIGCLFLGDGAAHIDPQAGRVVDTTESRAHIARAMQLGLLPTIVHAAFDAQFLTIPYRRMLAICFCCDCCCTIRRGMRNGPRSFQDTVMRLPGVEVSVGDACVGCGTCQTVCPIGAITVGSARASIDPALCKGCGACVEVCPQDAIELQIADEEELLARLLERIAERTDIESRATEA